MPKTLFSLPAILGDVHNFVLKNEKIGSALARQPHHVLVVILDPAADRLTIHQLHANQLLLLAQSLEEIGFFESLFRRRSEEHTSELQSHLNLVCRLLLEKKKIIER